MLRSDPLTLFLEDLAPRERTVRRVVKVELVQCEFDALVSFEFNTGGLAKSTLLKEVSTAPYRAMRGAPAIPTVAERQAAILRIEQQFAAWCNSGGKTDPGLVLRRRQEAAMFLNEARSQLASMTESPPWGGAAVPWGKSPAVT